MMLLTKNMYSSLIGKQFPQTSLKLLCALIDQRVEFGMPSFMLRTRLFDEIHRFNIKSKSYNEKQIQTENKMIRDLKAYPLNEEGKYTVQLTIETGQTCTLDIKHNVMIFSGTDEKIVAAPITYVSQFKDQQYVRLIKVQESTIRFDNLSAMDTLQFPTISKSNIAQCDNEAILELLLTVTDQERLLLNERACPHCGSKKTRSATERFVISQMPPAKIKRGRKVSTPDINSPSSDVMKYQCSECNTVFFM
ncbi:hypothetical protein [Paenibacillus sp. FSL L8-0463]|uniref:hypothetical protein n=1 Tax=Paenibacillus sp. FSL L8-0463 TaxID=2954687 RepID=UPI00311A0442